MIDGTELADEEIEEFVDEVRRLLRMKGGATPHGYIARGLSTAPARLGYRSNDPRIAARREELAGYGAAERLSEFFTVIGSRPRGRDQYSTAENINDVPVLYGRDIHLDHKIRLNALKYITPGSDELLQFGDIVVRSIDGGGRSRGFTWARVTDADLPLVASHHVVTLRPLPGVDRVIIEFVLRYLASKMARELSDVRRLGSDIQLTAHSLRNMVIPLPDEPVLFALKAVLHARDTAGRWEKEAGDALEALFEGSSVADSRAAVLRTSRALRLRITAAEKSEQFGEKVRTTYPLPIAARWRIAEATLSKGATAVGYQSILDVAENSLGYAASVGASLAVAARISLSTIDQLATKLARGEGPTFGDWVSLLDEMGGKKASPVRALTSADEFCDFAKNNDVKAAISRLRDRRNDEAHGRSVDNHGLAEACEAAWLDVQFILEKLQVLADMPLLLAGATDWDSIAGTGLLEVRMLAGDHSVVPVERLTVTTPTIENGSLYVRDAVGELRLLRPFVIARDCPTCRTLSTFHVDKVSEEDASLRSFEHGHQIKLAGVQSALAAVGLLHK